MKKNIPNVDISRTERLIKSRDYGRMYPNADENEKTGGFRVFAEVRVKLWKMSSDIIQSLIKWVKIWEVLQNGTYDSKGYR